MLGLPDFIFYLIAGVLGAFAVSWGRWFAHRYIPHFPDVPLLLGKLFARGKSEKTTRVVGRYMHLTTGALWGLLFGLIVNRQFFLVEFTVVSGLMFGILPWLFFMVIVKPLTGGGFFAIKVSSYRWLTSLALHLLYGAVLGGLLSIFINRPF